jgi:thymidylate kinase
MMLCITYGGAYKVIVEFIGLPGSGKSTVAKSIFEEKQIKKLHITYPLYNLYNKGWVQRNLIKFVLVINYFIFNFFYSLDVIKLIKSTKQNSTKNIIKLSFNFLFFLSVHKKYKESKDIVLFDEGLLHNVWAILYEATSKNIDYNKFILDSCLPNVVVYVECDIQTNIDRLLLRKSNTRIESSSNLPLEIQNSKKDIEDIISNAKILPKLSKLKLIKIDNSENASLMNNKEKIIQLIVSKERVN